MMQQKRRAYDDLISRTVAKTEARLARLRTEEAVQMTKATKAASQRAAQTTVTDVSSHNWLINGG